MTCVMMIVTALPIVAQYGRRSNGRLTAPRPAYATAYAPRHYGARGADMYYGLRLGVGASTVSSNDPALDGGQLKAGLTLGMVAGWRLTPGAPVSLETGLLYAEKGGKGSSGGRSLTYCLDYLEVPLLMKYCHGIGRRTAIEPFAGVYGAVGVGGKIKDADGRQAYSSFGNRGFKRWDAGLRLGCGLQHDLLYAELGYYVGLANVSHDDFDTAHTGCLWMSVGVNF